MCSLFFIEIHIVQRKKTYLLCKELLNNNELRLSGLMTSVLPLYHFCWKRNNSFIYGLLLFHCVCIINLSLHHFKIDTLLLYWLCLKRTPGFFSFSAYIIQVFTNIPYQGNTDFYSQINLNVHNS